MTESFDAFRYMSYMRLRWRWIAGSCATAVTIALAVSLALPREYTSVARIVIEPPGGMDPRSAMAVSPIYLESLKTYEHFAANDSIFRKAVGQFGVRASTGGAPIEALKKRVLKVGVVRNTRILEIAATLPDPGKAQAVARFVAEATVDLNQSMEADRDRDLLDGIEQQAREMRTRAEGAEAAWAKLASEEPVDGLQAAVESASELRSDIQRQTQSAELEIADAAQREKQAQPSELPEIRRESSEAQARLEEMRKQVLALDRENAGHERLLAARQAHLKKLDAEREGARAALADAEKRLSAARSDSGYRGERLRIIDPGTLPERPSSPNLPLNVVAALLLGLVLPVLYLTLAMNFQEHRATGRRNVFHAVGRTGDG